MNSVVLPPYWPLTTLKKVELISVWIANEIFLNNSSLAILFKCFLAKFSTIELRNSISNSVEIVNLDYTIYKNITLTPPSGFKLSTVQHASQHLINNDDKDNIVKFTAKWCSPCKVLTPILNKLSEIHQDISFYEIDVDEEYELSSRFNIRSVPTMLFISQSGKNNQQIGALTEGQMEKLISKYFKSGEWL